MEAIVSIFGSNSVAISFPASSTPSLLDLKQHLFEMYQIPIEDQRIQTAGGEPLSAGNDEDDEHVLLFERQEGEDSTAPMVRCFGLTMRMSGGKGGFGSMLRAQGGRMSSQKSTNTDACRDLSGRRIKTVNEAKRIAEYVQQEPERERARKESLKRKIEEKLELAERPTRKHRFDDSKFFDEAEEQVEEVKSAVAAAIKANMKSRSTSPPSPSGSTSSSSSSSSSSSPSSSSSSSSAAAAAAANIGDLKGKGKGKEKAKEVAPRKPVIKKLGMWDDMSDYESSEGEGEDEDEEAEEDEEDEEDEEGDQEDEAEAPSVGPSNSKRSSKSKVK